MKLWKVVKDRRQHKLAERQKAERDLDEAEEAVGRRIVEDSSRDRLRWEATYGDNQRSYPDQVDSGIGEGFESVRKGSTSIVNNREVGETDGDGIELSELNNSKRLTPADTSLERRGDENRPKSVTIRVVPDDGTDSQLLGKAEEKSVTQPGQLSTGMLGRNGSPRVSSAPIMGDGSSRHPVYNDGRSSVPPGPAIVPLPFTVPIADDSPEENDGSSTTTRADSIYAPVAGSQATDSSPSRKRSSMGAAKRPEVSSASQEALLIPSAEDDDASSIAATIDNTSDIGPSPLLEPSKGFEPIPDGEDGQPVKKDAGMSESSLAEQHVDVFRDPESKADNDSTGNGTPNPDGLGEHQILTKQPSSSSASIYSALESPSTASSVREDEPLMVPLPSSIASSQGEGSEMGDGSEAPEMRSFTARRSRRHASSISRSSETPKYTAKSELSAKRQRVSLSGQLPQNVSKVAMCYRTNEWAKHLTAADKPELEELEVTEDGVGLVESANPSTLAASGQSTLENAQPKATDENTRTTENNKVPPNLAHSSSNRSLHSAMEQRRQPLPRTVSNNTSTPLTPNNQQWTTSRSSFSNNPFMKYSIQSTRVLNQSQMNLNRGLRSVSIPIPRQSPFDSPAEIQAAAATITTSGGGPNTLLAQREHQIRNRYSSSSLNLNQPNPATLAPVPELEIHPNDSISISDQNSTRIIDEDNMSLSERKELLQQQQYQPSPPAQRSIPPIQGKPFIYDSHQPKRHSDTYVDPRRREAMLAQWRQSLRDESTGANTAPHVWAEAHRAERMRKEDMLDAHREAIRRMQAVANLHVS